MQIFLYWWKKRLNQKTYIIDSFGNSKKDINVIIITEDEKSNLIDAIHKKLGYLGIILPNFSEEGIITMNFIMKIFIHFLHLPFLKMNNQEINIMHHLIIKICHKNE